MRGRVGACLTPRAFWGQTKIGKLSRDEAPQGLRQLRAIASNQCACNMETRRLTVKERCRTA